MIFSKSSQRWALWVFAAAMLLKSAMPFLAQASAQMQGKTLYEVCTVYGVSLVAVDDSAPDPSEKAPASDHAAGQGSGHCALSTLATLASFTAPLLPPQAANAGSHLHLRAVSSAPPPDASALWFARLKHGPPAHS
jgi:hypothetical protein